MFLVSPFDFHIPYYINVNSSNSYFLLYYIRPYCFGCTMVQPYFGAGIHTSLSL